MIKRERRFLQSDISVETGETSPKITGYAAKFSPARSGDLGGFYEELAPGCFDKSLNDSTSECVGLFNHDANQILGRKSAGTLRLSVDSEGLKYEIDPPDTQVARDLMVSMRRKDVKSSSFGFFCVKDSYKEDKKTGQLIRTIHEAELFDVSPVVFPAYEDSSSQVRSLFPDDKGSIPESITSKIAELRTKQRGELRFKNILSAVASTKWAILPEKLETICALLNSRAAGIAATKEEIQAAMMGQDSVYAGEPVSSVAVLPVYGVVSQRMTLMAEFCGGFSCHSLTTDLRAAVADPAIKTIVLDIDSPGGSVTGVPELCAEILKLREQKEIIAVSNGMAASAAYWIAASCSKIVVTPSGEVGSIGVYQMHQDVSGALDKAGVAISFIKAGQFKTDGNPYEPLSDSARTDMQDGVNAFYEMFVEGVAAGRGVSVEKVKADFGQGRMLMAKDAVAAGMADSIATLDEVLAGLTPSDVAVAPQEPVETETDNGIEVTAIVADMNDGDGDMDFDCTCDCPECLAGDHADCTGNGEDCGFDDEDGFEMAGEVVPVVAEEIAPLSAEEQTEADENERVAYKVKLMNLY